MALHRCRRRHPHPHKRRPDHRRYLCPPRAHPTRGRERSPRHQFRERRTQRKLHRVQRCFAARSPTRAPRRPIPASRPRRAPALAARSGAVLRAGRPRSRPTKANGVGSGRATGLSTRMDRRRRDRPGAPRHDRPGRHRVRVPTPGRLVELRYEPPGWNRAIQLGLVGCILWLAVLGGVRLRLREAAAVRPTPSRPQTPGAPP